MILQHHSQVRRSRPLFRRGSFALAALVLFGALAPTATLADAQSSASVAIKVAGPSVTYLVDGCPDTSIADAGPYGVTFQTSDPNGAVQSSTGVRTGDRQYSLTTDIRSDDPSGQYLATASCNAPDGTVSFTFASTAFWVSDGVPSITPPEGDPNGGSDAVTTPEPTPPEAAVDPDPTATSAPDSGDSPTPSDPNATPDATQTPEPSATVDPVDDGSAPQAPGTTPSDPSADVDATQTPQTTAQDPTMTPSPTPVVASRVTSVQIQPTEATSGETVKTWVQGCPASVDGTSSAVTFSITTPSGAQKVAVSDAPSGDGSFSVAIRVPDSPEVGRYSVIAICGLRDGDTFVERREYSASSFEVMAKVGLDLPASTPTPSRTSASQSGSSAASGSKPIAQRPAIGFTG